MDHFTSAELKTLTYLLSKEYACKMTFQGFISVDGNINFKFCGDDFVRVVSFSEGHNIVNQHIVKACKLTLSPNRV